MVLIIAGNDALSTVKAQSTDFTAHEYIVFRDGDTPEKGFLDHRAPNLQRAGTGN